MTFHDAVMGVISAERPTFRNPLDKMAFAVHASFIASGYILLASGPAALAVLDPMNSQRPLTEMGIDGWDALDNNYAFIYSHPSNKPKRVFIRCVPVDAINEYLFVDAQSHSRHCWPFSVNILIRAFNEKRGRRDSYDSQYQNFDKLVNLIDQMLLSQVNFNPSDPPSNQLPSCLYQQLVPVIPVYWQPRPGTGVFHPRTVYGIGRGRFAGPQDAMLNWVTAYNSHWSPYQHFVMTYQFLVMAYQDWVNSESPQAALLLLSFVGVSAYLEILCSHPCGRGGVEEDTEEF